MRTGGRYFDTRSYEVKMGKPRPAASWAGSGAGHAGQGSGWSGPRYFIATSTGP